jgi:hypothetical protein
MVRGLHFHHAGEVLPEDWPTLSVQLFPLTETPPPEITLPNDVLAFASSAPSRGRYPGVLDYKFEKFPEANNVHYWLLLLWDRIVIRVHFHDPACTCEACKPAR